MSRLLLLLACIACISFPVDAAAQTTSCAERLRDSFRAEHGIPALAVAVARPDTVLFRAAVGETRLESNVPVTSATIFQLSSTAKLFTGVLAMRLVEQGRIELDSTITNHLPDAPAGWSRLTLRQLLHQVAGLPILEEIGADSAGVDPEMVLEELYRRAPDPKPGAEWVYGRADFFVATQVLERVGGAEFVELMREHVFDPAHMRTARYWGSHRDVVLEAATGYYPDTSGMSPRYEPREFEFPPHRFAEGGLAASLDDLLAFDRALRSGELLAEELLDELWADVRLENGDVVSYGLGWDTKTHAPGQRSAGHSGGYLTTFRTYPGSRLTAIVLANGFLRPFNPDDLATAFAAVWDPAIVGLDKPACSIDELAGATF